MTWWKVTVTSQQSITIGTGTTRAFHTPSLGYIPGSTMRGALARAWMMHGADSSMFRDIFDGTVRFGPLLAEGSDVANQSVARRKYEDGPNKFVDLAFSPSDEPPGTVEQLKGDVMWAAEGSMRTVVRSALYADSKTARDGSLFSREVHRRHQRFTGHIVGGEALVKPLKEFPHVSIGGQKSVLGRAELRIEPAEVPKVKDLKRAVLRTLSPTILIDDAGRPDLEFVSAFRGYNVEKVWGARLTTDGTSGWHAASNTPKPVDAAIAPGAVVVLQDPDPAKVAELLNRGIGTRRAEGFGWLELVTHPWEPPTTEEETCGLDDQEVPAALGWSLRARRSLADWLMDLGENDLDQIKTQRAWINLTDKQRKDVEKILRETPGEHRKAIASMLRRG